VTAGAVPLSQDCIGTPPPVGGCPHDNVNGDQITQAIPWNTYDYQLVHKGEFPWWNDLAGNGLPQFLNFESAPLSLPSLVGYLVPLSISFLVVVAMKLLIAGTGTYLAARLLGQRPLAAALSGSAFMLSGSFAGWLGWSISGTLCWAGYLLAALILCERRPFRAGPITLLAGSVAFAIYGGFVEAYALLAVVLGAMALLGGLLTAPAARRRLRAVVGSVGLGGALGVMLAAPLWLPGLGILSASVRSGTVSAHGIVPRGLELLFAAGYDGLPIAGSTYFGSVGAVQLPNYFESTTYVGVVVLILAATALLRGHRRRAIRSIGAAALVAALLAYRLPGASPFQRLVIDVHLKALDVGRVLPLLAFCLALLAGCGAELVVDHLDERQTRRALSVSFLAVAAVLGILSLRALSGLPASELVLRRESLYWPVGTLVLLVTLVAALGATGALSGTPASGGVGARLARIGGARLLVGSAVALEGAFLLFSGVGINSYAASAFPATALTTRLDAAVGSGLLGLDTGDDTCYRLAPGIGYYPNMNLGYGVDELALHDPTAPQAYFDSWPVPGVGQHPCVVAGLGEVGVNLFAPSIDTVALARRYGVTEVLAAPGRPAPLGMRRIEAIGSMTLYAVPGAARASFTAGPGDQITSVGHPGDSRYELHLVAPAAGRIVVRVTDSPGWKVTIDGRAVPKRRVDGIFISAEVPRGAELLTLSYRPPHLDLALALAASALALIALLSSLRSDQLERRLRPRARGASVQRHGAAGVGQGEPPLDLKV
jgi:Bacterial membrane protein YfhO